MKPWGWTILWALFSLTLVGCGGGGIDGTYENDLDTFVPPDLPLLREIAMQRHRGFEKATMTIDGDRLRITFRVGGRDHAMDAIIKNRTEDTFQITGENGEKPNLINILDNGDLECPDCMAMGLGTRWVRR